MKIWFSFIHSFLFYQKVFYPWMCKNYWMVNIRRVQKLYQNKQQ